jgi:UDP-N-acetylglucosamine 3-dehydrogenase
MIVSFSTMHKVALVGSGFIAGQHADAYDNIDNAQIIAIASKDDNRDEFADKWTNAATTHHSLEALLDEVDPDFVDICTPTHTHREVVEEATVHGYDILCEKPIAPSLEDGKAIVDAVTNAGSTFMVGHAVRFSAAYSKICQVIEDGDIGDPGVIRTSRVGPFPDWGWNNWFADMDKSGGVLLDLVIHDFDYLRWVLGDVEEVFVRVNSWRDGDDLMDHAVALLTFADGTVAHVEGSWAQPETRPFSFSIEVAGDGGLIEFDGSNVNAFQTFTQDEAATTSPLEKAPLQVEIEHFLECREKGIDPLVSVEDAVEAARISRAALESAESGEPVAVAEVNT